jgi:hypothetical protein
MRVEADPEIWVSVGRLMSVQSAKRMAGCPYVDERESKKLVRDRAELCRNTQKMDPASGKSGRKSGVSSGFTLGGPVREPSPGFQAFSRHTDAEARP